MLPTGNQSRGFSKRPAGPYEAKYVAGDLEEEFAMVRDSRGPAAARRWYAWQVARSVCALLELRVRSGELTQVALIASPGAPLLLLDRLWQFIYSQIPLKLIFYTMLAEAVHFQ